MGMVLHRITDPRDALEKARRPELVAYARQNGVTDINEAMPAILIRRKLREKGLTRPRIPDRILGQAESARRAPLTGAEPVPPEKVQEVDAIADLERQYAREAPKNPYTMTYNELRREGRRLGVKFARKDNLASIKTKVAAAMKGPAGG